MVEQPAESLRHSVGEHAAQRHVVARVEFAVEPGHVAPVILRTVGDALARLVRRLAGGHRADRPGGGAAELRVLLQQHDIAPERTRLDGSGKAAAAATDDNNVVGGLDGHGVCLARWPAVVPAILPKTLPFISPVPPG